MQTVSLALEHFRRGGLVLLLDEEGPGHLVVSAERAKGDEIALMKSGGVGQFLVALGAADPGQSVTTAGLPPHEIAKARDGGLLQFEGVLEAAVDIANLAGLAPRALVRAFQPQDVWAFAERHELPVLSIDDLTLYRRRNEAVLELVAVVDLPTRHALQPFRAYSYRSSFDEVEHLALVSQGQPTGAPLVRIHSECLTGDAFGSLRCDCGPQLDESMRRLAASPGGILVYMRGHEGRGIGLSNKMRAYALQDKGLDTVQANRALGLPADARDFAHAAQILRTLGHSSVRLLTNNPEKAASLQRYQIEVSQIEPLVIPANPFNARYLDTKALKFDHALPVQWHLG
jgi:3,4-dihydroxy 2-butanone 4-phosphate synthase / GTP cyclohydrolase II